METTGGKTGLRGQQNLANTSRSVMQKKFKINDGSSKHVEQSTLLEPANNSAALNDQAEIKEVSIQLSQIKKKHDEAKKMVLQKQEQLEQVKKEIEAIGQQEIQAEGPVFYTKSRLEQLQVAIDETDKKINEEGMTKASYSHMLERMKKDFIATKIKSSEMEGSLKNKSAILDIEQGKQRKTKEERLQSKAIFDSLMKNIEKEQRDRQERILELQKCIKNKEESVQRRIERQRRNQEIAEAAANENKDSSELRMREDLYIQKVYNIFIKNKMKQEMAHSQQIDDAFKAIKTAVVVNDVQEMVRKFLTREQTYSSLLVAVSESERKIDKVKKDNEELRARLHELQIDSDANAQKDDKNPGPFDEEIVEMNKKLVDQNYHQGLLNEKFKKINIVNDQISGWAKRVYTKFGALVDDPVFHQEPNDITKIFQAMDAISVQELRSMKEKRKSQEEDEDKGLEYGDVFNDFATEDFISKNIRVRPISGITHGDETRDGRQSNISRGGLNTEQNEEEQEGNYYLILELDEQRKAIKKAHREQQEEIKRKKALEAKDAENKKKQ